MAVTLVAALAPLAAHAGIVTTPAAKLSPGFTRLVEAGGPADAIVRFRDGRPADRAAELAGAGLRLGPTLSMVNAAQVTGPVAAVAALAQRADVEYIENNEQLKFADETGTWAIRVREAQEALNGAPYKSGINALDGTGVGIAIVDSGADGTHPDLRDHIVHNYKVGLTGVVDVGNLATTDTTSGHGTHVSGIAAGDGTASSGSSSTAKPQMEGTVTGVAPNAALTVYATGEGIHVLWAATAINHLVANYDNPAVFPQKIRVVNNSYGNSGGTAYDPNSSFSLLVKQLVNKGAVVVFAAGNDGGSGTTDSTSGFCKDTTPGVICAANYDDGGTGTRDGGLDSSSSRGRIGSPNTYPDVSAPGSFINSTCSPASGALCNAAGFITRSATWSAWYAEASGTSMASPMTSGAVALLAQAKPTLTPAQIEDILQDTAHKFGIGYESDPQNVGGTTSFDKGAGLIDLVAALTTAGLSRPTGAAVTTLSDNDGGDATIGATDLTALTVAQSATTVTFALGLRDATALPANGSVLLVVDYTIEGSAWSTAVRLTATGVEVLDIDPFVIITAPATSASRSGNTISITVPKANMGSPASGRPAFRVRARSLLADDYTPADVMPSLAISAGLDAFARPLYARPFAIS